MNKSIYYIANNPEVKPVLEGYIRTQGFEWTEYSIAEQPQVDYLMIVEPVRIGSELYTLSAAWKPWLMEFRPHTRLIVAAFAHSRHENCLNLLDLPENLKEWLKKTRGVTDFPMIESEQNDGAGKYVDPWKFGLISPGYDLQARMKKFVTGHFDEQSNLSAQIANIKNIIKELSQINLHLTNEVEDVWAEFESKMEHFKQRWEYYSPLFKFIPYQNAIKKISLDIEELDAVIKDKKLNDSGKLPLNNTLEIVKKEMIPYIFPEDYW